MMKRLTDTVRVSPQIEVDDLPAIAAAGVGSIICNRPDGESPDQPAFSEIAGAAAELGMEARHIPVVASAIAREDVEAFRDALDELPGPHLAFCKTGTRSTILWALANPDEMSVDERIDQAAEAGYDLGHFRSRLD